jgi:hypothetical protein
MARAEFIMMNAQIRKEKSSNKLFKLCPQATGKKMNKFYHIKFLYIYIYTIYIYIYIYI